MKPNLLLKIAGLCVFFLFTTTLKAQEQEGKTYTITDNGSVKDVKAYIDALNSANMRYHRLKNTRFTIVFETGVTVQLFSATELITNGRKISLEDYPDSFDSSHQKPIFSLGPNNFIMEAHAPVMKK